jgi:hypothetical protein
MMSKKFSKRGHAPGEGGNSLVVMSRVLRSWTVPVAVCLAWVLLNLAIGRSGSAIAVTVAVERRHIDVRTGMLEVPIDELIAVIRRKDRAEIGRVAEQIGPARLGLALRRADAPAIQAALAGIVVLPGGVRLVGQVTELVAVGDPPIAAAAAHTLGEILAPVTNADLDDWEVPPDVIASACATLRTAAIVDANPTGVRLAALDALADASAICAPTPELIALLRDPLPALRRSVALILRPQQRLATGGFASGTRDVDKSVASASIAILCELLGLPGGSGRASSREPIWAETKQAARRLAVVPETPAEDAVQMLECLDPTSRSDRQILDGLRGRNHTPLGDRAAEILSQAQGRARP